MSITDNKILLERDVCSNFDHTINVETVSRLLNGDCYANYPGWDFNANVIFEKGKFIAEVSQYGEVSSIESANKFEELKDIICNKYGND